MKFIKIDMTKIILAKKLKIITTIIIIIIKLLLINTRIQTKIITKKEIKILK